LRSFRVAPARRNRHNLLKQRRFDMPITFSALPTAPVEAIRAGAPDANGQPAERTRSDGDGNPCRHCLRRIPAGAPMLVLAWRPFPSLQPYAETGPIFLCAACARHPDTPHVPEMIARTDRYLLRGYGADHRIVYGTGDVVETARLEETAATLLTQPRVAYLHLRSARNNCYQLRIDRGPLTAQ
jgi:hypothetical protein